MTSHTGDKSPLVYTRTAGFLYILIIVIGVLNGIFVSSRLIVKGDDVATVGNIMANDLLFRTGTASLLLLYAGVLVLAWALYMILKDVDKKLALLGLLLRSAEAVLGAAFVLVDLLVLALLEGEGNQALVGSLLNVSTAGLDIVLVFVGLGGTLFCYLFLKSGYVPGLLAGWGIFTYLSMIVLSIISIIFPAHPEMLANVLYGLGALFELIFGGWLLFKGINVRERGKHAPVV